ncbi:MAG: ABC transporter ATP-binding protein, partial [Candidatus Omnitrophica bacterium]|nr:ABC transporter ATP-binding protein [Candidatus Omnitrophota bacterium]
MKVIEFSNLWQMYNIKFVRKGKVTWESIWALEDINISVDKGEVLGIIGQNGAGKSTLLKLIAGILTPDKGKVTVKGKISMLMELGAGFNPEFTGRENIILNAQLYGVPAERLDEKVEEIIAFSELGKFIDAPLKYYSQGMYARLAFSLAIHVDPDILLVDDILAVGDEEFQRKCIDRIFSLKNENKTIIVVTHNMQMVEKLCDRVLFLDQGRLVDIDACRKVVPRYLESLGEKEGIAVLHDEKIRVTFNNGKFFVSFNNVALTKKHGGYVSFLDAASQAWLTSFNFKWAVVEGKEKYMVAQGVSEDTDLKIGLRIDLDKDNLVVQAEIKGEGTNRAADLHLDLLLASFYSRYFTGESYYRMPSFASKLEWQSITQIKEADILGLSREGGNDIAHLIIEKDESDRFILFNTGYTDEGRVVSVYSDTQTLKFTMRLLADTSVFEEYLASYRQEYLEKLKIKQEAAFKESCLTAKDLQLLVDPYNKSVHLLYKNKEITAGSGLGVSLKQKEDLFTTANASKFTCAKEGDCLLVDIEWDQVHLAQRWRF